MRPATLLENNGAAGLRITRELKRVEERGRRPHWSQASDDNSLILVYSYMYDVATY